jgi:hypothetical protein
MNSKSIVRELVEAVLEQDVELIASYNEQRPASEDKIGPWMNKRHGVPNGYVYIQDIPWHFLYRRTPEAVKNYINSGNPPQDTSTCSHEPQSRALGLTHEL